jgi:hypothetical protein
MKRKKNRAAVALGRLGGKARAKKLSKSDLSLIGKLGGRPKKSKQSKLTLDIKASGTL